jgi:hypothetical protein
LEESDAVEEQVIVEVLVQVQQHVQVAIVDSQLIIDQFDIHIPIIVAVLNQVPSFHQSGRECLSLVLALVYQLIAVPVDHFNSIIFFGLIFQYEY